MKRTLVLVCVAIAAGLALLVGGFGMNKSTAEETMTTKVTPQTSLEELVAITPVTGSPTVTWARLQMGKLPTGDRDVPGPTDLMLTAILDYGRADEVNAVLAGASGAGFGLDIGSDPVKFSWWPEEVTSGAVNGELAVVEYLSVDGFGDGVVLKPDTLSRFLILRKALF